MDKKVIIKDLYYRRNSNAEYIFKNLNLNIKRKNGLIFILGPSGVGKSTFLHLLNGLLPVSKGSIEVNNIDLRSSNKNLDSRYWKETCSLMYQNFPLISWLTCKENLSLMSNKDLDLKSLTKKLNVESLLNKYPKNISFGQRQRIALIQTFLAETSIKLLDEPTSALGKKDKLKVIELIKDIAIKNNQLVFIATHDTDLIKFSDKIYEIEDKKLKNAF